MGSLDSLDIVGAADRRMMRRGVEQLRLLLGIRKRDKKYGVDPFFFQRIQNVGGIAVFVPLVKSQVNFF